MARVIPGAIKRWPAPWPVAGLTPNTPGQSKKKNAKNRQKTRFSCFSHFFHAAAWPVGVTGHKLLTRTLTHRHPDPKPVGVSPTRAIP